MSVIRPEDMFSQGDFVSPGDMSRWHHYREERERLSKLLDSAVETLRVYDELMAERYEMSPQDRVDAHGRIDRAPRDAEPQGQDIEPNDPETDGDSPSTDTPTSPKSPDRCPCWVPGFGIDQHDEGCPLHPDYSSKVKSLSPLEVIAKGANTEPETDVSGTAELSISEDETTPI